jgi:hypothetical protein
MTDGAVAVSRGYLGTALSARRLADLGTRKTTSIQLLYQEDCHEFVSP